MKVLILHQYFNTPSSGGALRSYFLARALVDKGISTVVITTHNDPHIEMKLVEGVEIHYLPVTYNNQYGFFKRIHSFLKFVLATVNYAQHFKDADLCYAISTPLTTGIAAIWIKLRYRIQFLFEVGDVWPEAPIQLGIVKNSLLKFILYRLEAFIYRQAKAIVALSDSIKKEIETKVTGKIIHVLPNMADTEYYHAESKNNDLTRKFGVHEKFVISYIGTLGIANGLDFLIDCARACSKNEMPVSFLVGGEGAERSRLEKLAITLSLTNISFLGFQAREGVKDILNVSDAVLISFQALPILETGSPNKYFDGLAAGKLIITNVKGWMKKEIERQQCGIYVDASQPHTFVEKIKPFIDQPVLLHQYQTAARKLAEETYSRKELSKRFSQLVSDN